MFFKKTNKFIIHYLMQLEPSSIACTTLVLPIVMIGLKKPFAPFSTDPNWKQTQS